MLIYISIIQICLIIQAVLLFACELTPVFSDHPVNVLLRTVLAICLVALSYYAQMLIATPYVVVYLVFLIVVALTVFGFKYLAHEYTRRSRKLKRLERIKHSSNYKNNAFQNLSPTQQLAEDTSFFKLSKQSLHKSKRVEPNKVLPFVKTDLIALPTEEPVIIWFGHSSYLIKINGKTILIIDECTEVSR